MEIMIVQNVQNVVKMLTLQRSCKVSSNSIQSLAKHCSALKLGEPQKCEIKSGCNGWVKPTITFFGEVKSQNLVNIYSKLHKNDISNFYKISGNFQGLPERFTDLMGVDFRKCDLLIIMGTSLMVAPVSRLPNMVRSDCPRK